MALAVEHGDAARELAEVELLFTLGAQTQQGDAAVFILTPPAVGGKAGAGSRVGVGGALGARRALAFVVVNARPQGEAAGRAAPGEAWREDEFVERVGAALTLALPLVADAGAGVLAVELFVGGQAVVVDGDRQTPGKIFVAAAQAGRKLAVGLVAARAGGQAQGGGRSIRCVRAGLLHDEVHRDRCRAAVFGGSAAQDLDAFEFAGGHATHRGQRVTGVSAGALAVDQELHRVAAHAAGVAGRSAVAAVAAGVDAGQLADHFIDGQPAQRLDFGTVDDGFLGD